MNDVFFRARKGNFGNHKCFKAKKTYHHHRKIWHRQNLTGETFIRLNQTKLGVCLYGFLKNAVEFFQHASQKNNLNWSEKHIRMLAEVTGGYPLGMKEFVKREIE